MAGGNQACANCRADEATRAGYKNSHFWFPVANAPEPNLTAGSRKND
jgi:hypothetical protein